MSDSEAMDTDTTRPPNSEADGGAPPPVVENFRAKFIQGSAWTLASYGIGRVLALGNQIILSYLLLPEAFGLMTLVNTFIQGLEMFSDFGLGPSIIQNRRGDEPGFLRTAWTLQVFRGFGLWFVALAIAWPMARFYNQPALNALLPVAGLSIIIAGFNSSARSTMYREVRLGRVSLIELGSTVVTIAVTIILALKWRNVWALVAGTLAGALARMALTHVALPGPKMRIEFHWDVAREIFRFSKWIFFSTILTFIVGRYDRLIIGKVSSMDGLGLYSRAVMMAEVSVQVVMTLGNKVLFPSYARLAERGLGQLRTRTIQVRAVLMALSVPPLLVLAIWGDKVILIFGPEYHPAGWMLQLLALGSVYAAMLIPISNVLLSVGNSFRHLVLLATRSAILLAAMGIGGHYYGMQGIIIGWGIANVAYYPVLAGLVRRYNVWLPLLDFTGMTVSTLAVLAGWWLRGWPGP